MRTDNLTFDGYFWRPNVEERKVPGTLSISDGGAVQLEILGNFDERLEHFNQMEEFPRILGRIESKGFVTLEHCQYRKKNTSFGGGIVKSTLSAQLAYLGIAFDEQEKVNLRSFQFSVEGLDSWHSITGLKSDFNRENHSATIRFQQPPTIQLWANNGFTLSLSFGWRGPSLGKATSSSIMQLSFFVLQSADPRPLDDFTTIAYRIVNLMSLAVDKLVSIRDVYVCVVATDSEIETPPRDQFVQLFFQSIFCEKSPPSVQSHKMLFSYERLAPTAQSSIEAWMSSHERLLPAISLYFSAQTEQHTFVSSQFLSLAQALEVYHSRTSSDSKIPDAEFLALREFLINACPAKQREFVTEVTNYWNQPTLRSRIERLLSRFAKHFGDDAQRAALAGEIVKMRNYYTHFDPKSKAKGADGATIWRLCMRMNALFRLCLLGELGFSEESIDEITKDSAEMQNRLKWKPQ